MISTIRTSLVGKWKQCPHKITLENEFDVVEALDANNALVIGTLIHEAIEIGLPKALINYYKRFPIIDDFHITEIMKVEYLLKKLEEFKFEGEHEVHLKYENFTGIIDLLVKVEDGVYDIYDFKYSNNIQNYLESYQIHNYKYLYELMTGNTIRKIHYVFLPKSQLRQKRKNKTNKTDETLFDFRKRTLEDLDKKEIQVIEVPYDPNKVLQFKRDTVNMLLDKEMPKKPSRLCDWCEYQKYCEEGLDYMLLPKNERVQVEEFVKKKIWLYGLPFSGKTYLANSFPDMLILSTDGNYTQLPGGIPPHIDLKDEVKVEGRLTKRKFAWQIFKDVIDELEKNQNEFRTLVLDLLEDTYESCRLFMYDKLGITHESDDSFRAWDKVRTEFLSTIRRFMNLPYENVILISHEDQSRDITKKSGDKITSIRPNLQEKTALKLAGMVDIVTRVVNEDGNRTLTLKTNEVIFGGGRLQTTQKDIPCTYDAILKLYGVTDTKEKVVIEEPRVEEIIKEELKEEKPSVEEQIEQNTEELVDEIVKETPVTPERKRRTRK